MRMNSLTRAFAATALVSAVVLTSGATVAASPHPNAAKLQSVAEKLWNERPAAATHLVSVIWED
jgi:hypothetical protein